MDRAPKTAPGNVCSAFYIIMEIHSGQKGTFMYTIHFDHPNHVHFIGIGGISMSGLAEVLLEAGFRVTGSDMNRSALTEKLSRMGALISYPQSAENITPDIDLVVYTAAISEDNPEFVAARKAGLPMLPRAEVLGQIMANYSCSVAVSGTHGKTTTTSMLSHILLAAGADPTISVGGMLSTIGGNIRVGASQTFLTEACEYTNSFLHLYPKYTIILNIEADHLDFFKDIDDIRRSFRQFARQTAPDGLIIINGDIDRIEEITGDADAPAVTFGMSEACLFHPEEITFGEKANCAFDAYKGEQCLGHVQLQVPGLHNVSNSLAAIALSDALGIPFPQTVQALASFHGTDRRFEYKGSYRGVTVIDDYAHHPSEISATLAAAQRYPHERLIVVFQPHTYSRTAALLPDFGTALSAADLVLLPEIYAAREKNTIGITSDAVREQIELNGTKALYIPDFSDIEKYLSETLQVGDLLITMGAGNVYKIGESLISH